MVNIFDRLNEAVKLSGTPSRWQKARMSGIHWLAAAAGPPTRICESTALIAAAAAR